MKNEERVWTPRTTNGKRLRFPVDSVEFLEPLPRRAGGCGKVRIGGKEYKVKAASCGLSCYCDAIIVGYKANTEVSSHA